jgi:hypothetical protein
MTVNLSPSPVQHFTDNNGNLLTGGKLFTYQAGTTTKQNAYTDSSGATAFANPIILNARGEPTNPSGFSSGIWLTTGVGYKFVLSPASDTDPPTNPFWTVDQISAPGAGSGTIPGSTALIDSGTANAYVAGFSPAPANQAAVLDIPFCMVALNANTGASTLNLNGFGVKAIVRRDGSACIGGEILAGQFVWLAWNGTAYQFIGIGAASAAAVAAGTDTQSYVTPADLGGLSSFMGFNQTVYSTPGTATFTPPTGVTKVYVTVIGGGGGGGATASCSGSQISFSGGGNGGSRGSGVVTVTAGVGVTVTVGAGGAGGVPSGPNGATGGTSSFGALIVAPGGGGAPNASAVAYTTPSFNGPNPVGYVATGGALNEGTPYGNPGIGIYASTGGGGNGGGDGGGDGAGPTGTGGAGFSPGGGGGGSGTGASGAGQSGGNGASGIVIVRW